MGSAWAELKMDDPRQTIGGFGFCISDYGALCSEHPSASAIYTALVNDLQPTILQVQNRHEIDELEDAAITLDSEFIQRARKELGYKPRILLSAENLPHAMLCEDESEEISEKSYVLAKDEMGRFRYSSVSRWWCRSLEVYSGEGIRPHWISIQSEPDKKSSKRATWSPTECFETPGYFRAAEELFHVLQRTIENPPSLVGPDCSNVIEFIDAFPYRGDGLFAAVLQNIHMPSLHGRGYALDLLSTYQLRKDMRLPDMFVTLHSQAGPARYTDPLRIAIVVHKCLVLAEASSVVFNDGGSKSAGGALVQIDEFSGDPQHWANPAGFNVSQSLQWFMHFSRSIRPGFRRVVVDLDVDNVLTSAWVSPKSHLSVIFINGAKTPRRIDLKGYPPWAKNLTSNIYVSTLDEQYHFAGEVRISGQVSLDLEPRSITTVESK